MSNYVLSIILSPPPSPSLSQFWERRNQGEMSRNYVFDLDAALTMDNSDNDFVIVESETKTTESKVQDKVSDILIMMMPTDLSLPRVCTICMEALDSCTPASGEGGRRVRCGHVYHENCIAQWLSLHSSCPLCRTILSGDSKTSVVAPSIQLA